MKIKKTVNILISCMTIWILISWLLLTMITLNASAEAPGIVSGETYWIVNAHSGKVLDARNNGTTSGTNVIQWQNKNASNQKWQVTYNSSGDYYTIRPTHTSGLYLSADSTTLSNGVNACIKTGSSSNAARWKIEKNNKSSLDNGNYIIRSKINSSYALTTTGAKTTDGANVMLYTYSIHNNCNDEWIFVKCSGYALRSVNIAVQQDQSYLTRYNNQKNEVNKTIADAAKPFYTKWHIEFRPSYYTLSSMKLDNCPNGSYSQCTSTKCGSTCENRISAPNHHKNFDYNALNAWKAYGMDGKDMRLVLVGAQLCHKENGAHKNNALGWWPSGKNGMVQQNRTHMLNVRVIQHELSHTYGVAHCTSAKCIMNGGFDKNYVYNLDNIWCSSCAKQFDRTEY